ncbi:MAG: DUF4347 domain-containing protein, partial [Acidobacteria bacterium]|nr:DUF4347 domain-containing protein [Acidobacteriota bacterium]
MAVLIALDYRVSISDDVLSRLSTDAHILRIGPDSDGIRAIADWLQTSATADTSYSSLELISHGSPGSVLLGNAELSSDTLAVYHDELKTIGNSLAGGGDIRFYGWDIGEGEAARSFLQTLSDITGADIAASDDPTGPSHLTNRDYLDGAVSSFVFVDAQVQNIETLLSDFGINTKVVVLNANEDGFAQVRSALKDVTNLDSIHIVSHGSVGALHLGTTTLTETNLAEHEAELTAIGSALSETGDILLYGCDIAQGEAGAQFIQKLAEFTGADVAASSDLTGTLALGGNATLEASVGEISTAPILAQEALDANGLLLTKYTSSYGASTTNWVNLTAGTHTFEINGVPDGYQVAFFKNNVFLGWKQDVWYDDADWTVAVSTTDVIEADIYNSSYVYQNQLHKWVRDAFVPTAPGTPDLASGSDSGRSNTDNVTNDTTPAFSWTAATDSQSGVVDYAWKVDT